jgi:hypothetical protein
MTTLESIVLRPETLLCLFSLAVAVSLAGGVGLVVAWACRRRSTPWRHGVLVAALTLILLSPAAVWLGQGNRLALVRLTVSVPQHPGEATSSDQQRPSDSKHVSTGLPAPCDPAQAMPTAAPASIPVESSPPRPPGVALSTEPSTVSSPSRPGVPASPEVSSERAGDSPHQAAGTRAAPAWWQVVGTLAACGWAIGVLVGVVRLGWGYVAVARLRRSFERLPDARLERLARQAAHILHLRKAPPVFVSGRVPVPISVGLREPAIALPKDMARERDNDRLGAVLLHETAHIARRDHWVGLGQRIAVVLFSNLPAS